MARRYEKEEEEYDSPSMWPSGGTPRASLDEKTTSKLGAHLVPTALLHTKTMYAFKMTM
jgi:hypothetical protein